MAVAYQGVNFHPFEGRYLKGTQEDQDTPSWMEVPSCPNRSTVVGKEGGHLRGG